MLLPDLGLDTQSKHKFKPSVLFRQKLSKSGVKRKSG